MSEKIRYYFDQHIPIAVAQGLRRRGVFVLTSQEANRCGSSDIAQLQFASERNLTLVTFDDDLLGISSRGATHTGIAFCSANKYSIGELIYVLLLMQELLKPEEMINHIEFL